MLDARFGIDHTTLQIDHESDELVQIAVQVTGASAAPLTVTPALTVGGRSGAVAQLR